MYVIFPAEEVVDLTLGIVTEPRHHGLLCPLHRNLLTDPGTESTGPGHKQQQLPPPPKLQEQRQKNKTQQTKKEKRKTKRHKDSIAMAGGGEASLRELTHPALNEALKAHNAVTFKLVRTVEDDTVCSVLGKSLVPCVAATADSPNIVPNSPRQCAAS
ncbi:uncharacterized protein LOC126249491 [Schistocerca nitens]|uniref:uncharacterized protein LOC126249491 n=1 Tax=Schistocerca nitens TaxID=7011 RepID=UPI0021173002|nr:uncharacterized protein LOC126249491 [Schistocerca nitens]